MFFKSLNLKNFKRRYSGIINLEKNKEEWKIDNIVKEYLNIDYNTDNYKFSKFVNENNDNSKLVLKNKLKDLISNHYILLPHFYDELIKSFSKYSKQKISLVIEPYAAKYISRKCNLKISFFKSYIFWKVLIISNLVKGIIFGFYYFFKNLKLSKENKKNSCALYFDIKLSLENFNNNSELDRYNIVNKYLIINNLNNCNIFTKKLNKNHTKILENNKNLFLELESPYPNLDLLSNFKLLFWIIISSIYTFFKTILGDDYHSFMYTEFVKNKVFTLAKEDTLFDHYIFPYMGSLNRPLWTFFVEEKRKKVSIFFYSTNGDGHNFKRYTPNDCSNWGELIFRNFIVWDDYQKEHLQKYLQIKNYNIDVYGPVLINSEIKSNNNFFGNNIVVFDISPRKRSLITFSVPTLIKSDYVCKFLSDIHKLSIKYNSNFILRKKHKLTNHLPHEAIDKKYIAQINKIKSSKSFIFDRTNSNIFDLIKSSNICISFPYSSTAILAKELGKPSIYYDPSNQIDKYNKKFSHGIHVINNFDTLDEWIGQNLS